ncbi:hypothetical protein ML8HA_01102 [Lactococcus lactis]|nr:hypothetical protein [Lactococcus lactis]
MPLVILSKGRKMPDAQQSSHVMLEKRGMKNPILLMRKEETAVTHSCQVNEEDLFYLQSRGLDEETAKRLVIRGFLGKKKKKKKKKKSCQ